MYLFGNKFFWTNWNDDGANRKEDGINLKDLNVRLGYWRKHPNLHGYIVKTFAEGVDECQNIGLSRDDLLKIVQAVKEKELPETDGFFFGTSDETEAQIATDIATLQAAINWADVEEKGVSRSIVYRASW